MASSPRGGGASRVFLGILASRLVGFLRDRAIAHYFGVSAHADVFRTALRGPNMLQNLLGEGTISAAFVPIYSRMLEEGRERDAGRFAGAILGLLICLAATLALLGVVLAKPVVALFAPGFLNDARLIAENGGVGVDRFALTVAAVKLIFPMTAILVLSAWALGVLNSHRRFLLAYLAPVLWNLAIIAALAATAFDYLDLAPTGAPRLDRFLFAACAGALVGAGLQFLVQLPVVLRETVGLRLSLSTRIDGVSETIRAFGPVVAGRGVYQLSAYFDTVLATFLIPGAAGAIGYAQALYILPVSLFGLSIAASELPELSRKRGEVNDPAFGQRVIGSLRQMAYLTVPTMVGYVAFGLLIVGALYRTGSFGLEDAGLVHLILAAYSLGLIATTSSRLLQNTFYALGDTRTPARIAVLRVVASMAVAIPAMLYLDNIAVAELITLDGPGRGIRLGAMGLAIGSAVGAWVEIAALRRSLRGRVAGLDLPVGVFVRMTIAAMVAVAPAMLLWRYAASALPVIPAAALVVGLYAGTYLTIVQLAGLSELAAWTGKFRR